MKIIFFGSDDFAARHLKALCDSKHQVLACVTQPARAKGRHLEIKPTVVKELALQNNIQVLEPATLKDPQIIRTLRDLGADIFVVVAYGKKLPKEIMAAPKHFCVNVHGSLLPKYRGAAPVNWAIINGEEETGVTIFKINKTLDTGEIISQRAVPIEKDDTASTLRFKICQLGAELLLETLEAVENDNYTLTRQDPSRVSHAPKLTKENGVIHWEKSAAEIHNLVRGLLSWPGAYTYFNGKLLKLLETALADIPLGEAKPGEIIEITKDSFTVATGKGSLQIRRVHLESSKPMEAKNFLAGHKVAIGFRFE